MYAHADTIRAVELYIKLGKRVKATIRQLGYPTKNALGNWYREYEQHRELRVRSVARAPMFSDTQKQAALEHYSLAAGPITIGAALAIFALAYAALEYRSSRSR
ncbi:hypothetical protein [Neorhizobium vignae]|jgi:transposase-like protein|uniref:hypothetical protein n=1 Tax=Neorhizobium vignae TaxID=690585 RepID=UPI003D80E762